MGKLRVIIVPLNEDAAKRLEFGVNYDKISEMEYRIWKIKQSEFDNLITIKIFDKINDLCNVAIDDFENEKLDYSKLKAILELIEKSNLPRIDEVKQLEQMIQVALFNETFVEFDF